MTEVSASSGPWASRHVCCSTTTKQHSCRHRDSSQADHERVGSGPAPENLCPFSKPVGIILPLVSRWNYQPVKTDHPIFRASRLLQWPTLCPRSGFLCKYIHFWPITWCLTEFFLQWHAENQSFVQTWDQMRDFNEKTGGSGPSLGCVVSTLQCFQPFWGSRLHWSNIPGPGPFRPGPHVGTLISGKESRPSFHTPALPLLKAPASPALLCDKPQASLHSFPLLSHSQQECEIHGSGQTILEGLRTFWNKRSLDAPQCWRY